MTTGPLSGVRVLDFGLLTADPDICADVNEVFLHITSLAKAGRVDPVEIWGGGSEDPQLGLAAFVAAIALILIFAVKLGWFPAVGYVPFTENPAERLDDLEIGSFCAAADVVGFAEFTFFDN